MNRRKEEWLAGSEGGEGLRDRLVRAPRLFSRRRSAALPRFRLGAVTPRLSSGNLSAVPPLFPGPVARARARPFVIT